MYPLLQIPYCVCAGPEAAPSFHLLYRLSSSRMLPVTLRCQQKSFGSGMMRLTSLLYFYRLKVLVVPHIGRILWHHLCCPPHNDCKSFYSPRFTNYTHYTRKCFSGIYLLQKFLVHKQGFNCVSRVKPALTADPGRHGRLISFF